MPDCVICSKDNSSYKCPVCRIPYCSVICCNAHKEQGCTKINEEVKNIEQNEEIITNQTTSYDYKTQDTIQPEKLEQLKKSKEVQNILSNKHLRDIISELDSCKNPNDMLEMAMKEPIFTEFVDACLQIVDNGKT